MSEAKAEETLALSLPRSVYRNLDLFAAASQLDFGVVVELALQEYLAVIERCDPDVRELVRALVPSPIERN